MKNYEGFEHVLFLLISNIYKNSRTGATWQDLEILKIAEKDDLLSITEVEGYNYFTVTAILKEKGIKYYNFSSMARELFQQIYETICFNGEEYSNLKGFIDQIEEHYYGKN